jgi:hypothetical protein
MIIKGHDEAFLERSTQADATIEERLPLAPEEIIERVLEDIIERKSALRWTEAWCHNMTTGVSIDLAVDTDVIIRYLQQPISSSTTSNAVTRLFDDTQIPFWLPLGTLQELYEHVLDFGREYSSILRITDSDLAHIKRFPLHVTLRRMGILSKRMERLAEILRSDRYLGALLEHDQDITSALATALQQQPGRASMHVNNTRDAENIACVWKAAQRAGRELHKTKSRRNTPGIRIPLLVSLTKPLFDISIEELLSSAFGNKDDVRRLRYTFRLGETPERHNWLVERPEETMLRLDLIESAGDPHAARTRVEFLLDRLSNLQTILREQKRIQDYPRDLREALQKGRRHRNKQLQKDAQRIRESIQEILPQTVMRVLEGPGVCSLPGSPEVEPASTRGPQKRIWNFQKSLYTLLFCLEEGLDKYAQNSRDKKLHHVLPPPSRLVWHRFRSGVGEECMRLYLNRKLRDLPPLMELHSLPQGCYVASWESACSLAAFLESVQECLHAPLTVSSAESDQPEMPMSPGSRYYLEGLVLNIGGILAGYPIPRPINESSILRLARAAFLQRMKESEQYAFEHYTNLDEIPLNGVRICTHDGDFGFNTACVGDMRFKTVYLQSHIALPCQVALLFRHTAEAMCWESELISKLKDGIKECLE